MQNVEPPSNEVNIRSFPGDYKIYIIIVLFSAQHYEYEWKYTSEIFYSLEFLGVPIIVSNVYLRKTLIS